MAQLGVFFGSDNMCAESPFLCQSQFLIELAASLLSYIALVRTPPCELY